jgi:hypothetical protein
VIALLERSEARAGSAGMSRLPGTPSPAHSALIDSGRCG